MLWPCVLLDCFVFIVCTAFLYWLCLLFALFLQVLDVDSDPLLLSDLQAWEPINYLIVNISIIIISIIIIMIIIMSIMIIISSSSSSSRCSSSSSNRVV